MSKIVSKLAFALSITSAVGLYSFSLAPSALAARPSTTTATPATATCNITNVSIKNTTATACKGPFSGNDTGAGNPLLTQLQNGLFDVGSGVTWKLAGKSDSNDNNEFGFEAQNAFNTGSWSLDKSLGQGLNTFVISLKTSTNYSAYLFKDIDFSKTGLEGIFNTIGVALDGSGKQGKGLSHASLFKATYTKPVTPDPKRVPEPTTTVALGFFTMGALRVLKKKPLVQD